MVVWAYFSNIRGCGADHAYSSRLSCRAKSCHIPQVGLSKPHTLALNTRPYQGTHVSALVMQGD